MSRLAARCAVCAHHAFRKVFWLVARKEKARGDPAHPLALGPRFGPAHLGSVLGSAMLASALCALLQVGAALPELPLAPSIPLPQAASLSAGGDGSETCMLQVPQQWCSPSILTVQQLCSAMVVESLKAPADQPSKGEAAGLSRRGLTHISGNAHPPPSPPPPSPCTIAAATLAAGPPPAPLSPPTTGHPRRPRHRQRP